MDEIDTFTHHLYEAANFTDSPRGDRAAALIADRIFELLQHEPDRVRYFAYRFDLNEADFKRAMQAGNDRDIAQAVAGLIIRREIKKIDYRRRYSAGNNQGSPIELDP